MADTATLWKKLTAEGNALFDAGDPAQALIRYEAACTLALAQFSQWVEADDAVASVVVSYLNLSEAQARTGLLAKASATLCMLHGNLLKASVNRRGRAALREAAERYLQQTFAALLRFRQRYGERPEMRPWLCDPCLGEPGAPLSASNAPVSDLIH